MIKHGFIEEVEKLRAMGYSEELPSMQSIGYRHVNNLLSGEWIGGQCLSTYSVIPEDMLNDR